MSSAVAICNLALSNIGKYNISSLNEPTAEARACNQFYDLTRDLLLQSYPWRFAGKTRALSALANPEAGKWRYAYQRPNDCLKVRWLRPNYSEADPCFQTEQEEMANHYEIEQETIYTNIETAFLRYTSRITDPSKFAPLFVDALAWHLATRLAMPLTRDVKQRQGAYEVARAMQAMAEMADANETRHSSDHSTEFVTGRYHG